MMGSKTQRSAYGAGRMLLAGVSLSAFAAAANAQDIVIDNTNSRVVTNAGTTPSSTGAVGLDGNDTLTITSTGSITGNTTSNSGGLILLSGTSTGVVIDNSGILDNNNALGGTVFTYQTGSGSNAQTLAHNVRLINRAGALMESGNGPILLGSTSSTTVPVRDQSSVYVIDNAGTIRMTRTDSDGAVNTLYLNATATQAPSFTFYNRAGGRVEAPRTAMRLGTGLVDNAGTITAAAGTAIDFRGNEATGTIINRAGSLIEGQSRAIAGANGSAYNGTTFTTIRFIDITNLEGGIIRARETGAGTSIAIGSASGLDVDNAGVIEALGSAGEGIVVTAASSPESIKASNIVIRSTGRVTGAAAAIRLNGDTDPNDTVTLEAGATIQGLINLGGGTADTLNLAAGAPTGTVGAVSNAEIINVTGSAWTLTGDITGATTTTIDSGASLQFGNGGIAGSVDGAIVNNGSLIFARSDSFDRALGITGIGDLSVSSGELLLSAAAGANSYSGATVVASGTLRAGQAGSLSSASAVTVEAPGTLDVQAGDQAIAGLSGTGIVNLGASTLTFGGATDSAFSGTILGTGGLAYTGTGVFTLSGVNSYTGATNVQGGTLVSSSAILGPVNVTAAGFTTTSTAGNVAASGGSNIVNNGTLASADIQGGSTLSGNGQVIGNVTLGGSSTLSGVQNVGGTLAVGDGSTVSPGGDGTIATITIGALELAANSVLSFDFAAPNQAAGVGSDFISVVGNLTLDGILDVTDVGGFGAGVYRLIGYGGTLTDNGLMLGSLPDGVLPADLQIQTSEAGFVNLISNATPNAPPPPAMQFWDGSNPALYNNGQVNGGSGIWQNAGSPSWTTANGTANNVWGGGFAVFQGAAGTVSVSGTVQTTGMQFLTDGYVVTGVTGSSIALADPQTAFRIDDAGTSVTISSDLSGAGGIAKRGNGTVVLSGNNTNSGQTVIEGGVLAVSGGNALSDTLAVNIVSPGQLALLSNETIGGLTGSGSVALGSATLTLATAADASYAGTIGGSGALLKSGAATQTLAATNSYSGGTTINGGTLRAGANDAFGAGALSLGAGGTADLADFTQTVSNLSGSGAIVLGSGNLSVASGSSTAAIAGTGTVRKIGTGGLTLGGASSYTGGTSVESGTLTLGSAAALGSGPVRILGGATLSTGGQAATFSALDGAGSLVIDSGTLAVASGSFSGVVSGAGALDKVGAGTLTLSGANTYSGGTTITAGTLLLGRAGALGTGPITLLSSGTLGLNNLNSSFGALGGTGTVQIGTATLTLGTGNVSSTFGGTIAGTGSVAKAGTGTLILSGTNTYSGGTSVAGGTLQLGSAGALGSGPVALAGGTTLALAGTNLAVNVMTGTGTVSLGSGTLTLGGANGTATFAGAITGTGGVIKAGTGTYTLSGNSTYTGSTLVGAGTLVNNGTLASLVTVASGARLTGTGRYGGLNIAGTFAPGTGIGTANVTGNVAFGTGSTYEVQLNQAGQSDLIAATGTASLSGGTLAIQGASETGGTLYSPLTRYTILTANGGVSGRFANVTSNLAFLTPLLTYQPNIVNLTLVRNDASVASVGGTPNQASVGAAIDAVGVRSPLFLALLPLSQDGARSALDQLSGEVYAGVPSVIARSTAQVRQSLLETVNSSPKLDGVRIWGKVFRAESTFEQSGFAKFDGRQEILSGGIDVPLGDLRIGLSAGRTTSEGAMAFGDDTYDIAATHVAAHAGGAFGKWTAWLGAGYGDHEIGVARSVAFTGFADTAVGMTKGKSIQVFGELGYNIGSDELRIEPFVGFAYDRVDIDGFSEEGGDAALDVGDIEGTATSLIAGIRGDYAASKTIRLKGSLFDRYYLDASDEIGVSLQSPASPYTLVGQSLEGHTIVADIGIEAQLGMAAIGGGFRAERADGYSSDSVRADVTLRF